MKRILGIAMVLGLVGALTVIVGCSKPKEEPPTEKVETKKIDKEGETAAQEVKPGKIEVVDLGKDVKLEMVLIPAGKFKMGAKKNPVDPFSNIKVEKPSERELPQHDVTLTKPFYMGKYEVTQEQWFEIMGENPSENKGRKLPVTDVSWEDCQEFINKLNAKTNGGYRLPTEAEWEYACRAGTSTAYSFGDKITPKDANYRDSEIGKPVAIGSYKPNPFGLYDMHGNVWELCEDYYEAYSQGYVTDPKGPKRAAKEERRVVRGGSYFYLESTARSSYRDNIKDAVRDSNYGFRLARTPDIKAGASLTAPKSDPIVITPATKSFLVTPFAETKAKEVQKEVAKSLQKEVEEKADLGKGVNLEMVLIPAGKFMMGSKKNPVDPFSNIKVDQPDMDELPQHEVTLTKPFYMGKYEVTQEQWFEIMGENPSREKGRKLPVTEVSWYDCHEFIKKLNAETNGGYRLPTESEWEYACRAGTTTAYSFGDKITPKDANYRDSGIVKPVAVGSYKPNAFGLYDMYGNVCEMCEDWYGDYPKGAVTDPKGPATGKGRVLRGVSFDVNASIARSSKRGNYSPTDRYSGVGFRLARTP